MTDKTKASGQPAVPAKPDWLTGKDATGEVRLGSKVGFKVIADFELKLPNGKRVKKDTEFTSVLTITFAKMVNEKSLALKAPKEAE